MCDARIKRPLPASFLVLHVSRPSALLLFCMMTAILFLLPLKCVAADHDHSSEKQAHGVNQRGEAAWLPLGAGLDFGEFRLDGQNAKVTILKIDPDYYDFVLYNSSNDGSEPRTLEKWADEKDLVAVINASMYLPDNGISTGYMRSGLHVNNGRIVKAFGGFFLAGPRERGLPYAEILDREDPHYPARLDKYETVIQNYRLTNAKRHILWPPGGNPYAISAIGQDGSGNILFIHSQTPVDVYGFAQHLLHLPLDIRSILYAEGGAQAGFLLRSPHLSRDLAGPHAPSFLATGNMKARLPNVLGIRARSDASEEKSLQNFKN